MIIGIIKQPIIFVFLTSKDIEYIPNNVEIAKIQIPNNLETPKIIAITIVRVIHEILV